jgi:hypothetical protein
MRNKLFALTVFALFLATAVYTFQVMQTEGFDLFTPFFQNLTAINWSGQFNLDFSAYLVLSGWWVMYRNSFSAKGIALGVSAMILGIVFFAPYLWLTYRASEGKVERFLTGK